MSKKFFCLFLVIVCIVSLGLTGCKSPAKPADGASSSMQSDITESAIQNTTGSTTGAVTESTSGSMTPTETPSDEIAWDDDDTLKILTIGNSFSVDCMEYVYQIAKAAGVKKVKLGNLYVSGCSLDKHLSNAKEDSKAYTFYTNESGKWVTNKNYRMSTAVKSDTWDFISFQQASQNSGKAETYAALDELLPIVENLCPNKKVEFMWHMTWAYQADSTHSGFANYNNDQMVMYNAIVDAVKAQIVPNPKFTRIVPNGTAVQNARTSYLGDTLTRDGYHMSKDKGRLLTGITMVATTVGIPWDTIDLKAVYADQFFLKAALESVKNAVATPFAVTPSTVKDPTQTIDFSQYEQLTLPLNKNQYWQSAKGATLVGGSDTAKKYFATDKFSKEEIPVGSLIVLADGWKYRPEGWVGDGLNSSSARPAEVTTKIVAVTEEWWGQWTTRAFNIAKKDGGALTDYTPEQIAEAIKIYVPKK